MRVEVAYVGEGREACVALDVPPGTTVAEAVAHSCLVTSLALPVGSLGYAIHGRRVDATTRLGEHDRVDITRPLVCDPRLARRRRAEGKA
jgi:putative ubiquitin-RnfH superfamily antitoxin RatB of RatAB toxin-antitoxin module